MVSGAILFVMEKSGEIILTLLLEKILKQTLSDHNLEKMKRFAIAKTLILYFLWLVQTSKMRMLNSGSCFEGSKSESNLNVLEPSIQTETSGKYSENLI